MLKGLRNILLTNTLTTRPPIRPVGEYVDKINSRLLFKCNYKFVQRQIGKSEQPFTFSTWTIIVIIVIEIDSFKSSFVSRQQQTVSWCWYEWKIKTRMVQLLHSLPNVQDDDKRLQRQVSKQESKPICQLLAPWVFVVKYQFYIIYLLSCLNSKVNWH